MKTCHNEVVIELKRIGQSGQITLGKQYAGKLLRVEKLEDGRFILTPVVDVPESQLWTLQEPHKSRIRRGLEWAENNEPVETDLDELLKQTQR